MLTRGRLLLLLIVISSAVTAQLRPVELHLKKNGKVKKKIEPGTKVRLEDIDGVNYAGVLTFMYNDTIVLNSDVAIPVGGIRKIKMDRPKRWKPIDPTEFAWVTFGVALTAFGLAMSKLEPVKGAIITALAIGYTPYLLRLIKSISFKKYSYRLGRKYSLRVWDLN
jgi:hypothetical protein